MKFFETWEQYNQEVELQTLYQQGLQEKNLPKLCQKQVIQAKKTLTVYFA